MATYSKESERDISKELIELQGNTHALISFRAIVAGLLIAVFMMIGLTGLGLGLGWLGIPDEGLRPIGPVNNIWFILSVFISLVVGSYFASRVSKYRMGRVGSVQGLVIASLFLGLMLFRPIFTSGPLGSVGFVIDSLSSLGSRPGMNDILQAQNFQMFLDNIATISEEAVSDLDLKSGPEIVGQGIGLRIFNGNDESAKNYLMRETDITPIEADAKISQIRMQVDKLMSDARMNASEALRATGQMLFILLILGSLAGVLGGGIGSVVNFRRPLVKEDLFSRKQTV